MIIRNDNRCLVDQECHGHLTMVGVHENVLFSGCRIHLEYVKTEYLRMREAAYRFKEYAPSIPAKGIKNNG